MRLQCRYREAFLAYAGCNLVLAAAAAALCAYIAPAAAGSGIPEVKAYLNGVDAHSILAPSTLFVKVIPYLILLIYMLCHMLMSMQKSNADKDSS